VILAGTGFLVLHLRGNGSPQTGQSAPVSGSPHASSGSTSPSSPSQSSPATSPPALAGPRAVLTDYYNAINNQDYRTAYGLNIQAQNSESYAQFRNGFAGTQHDVLTITGVSGDTVSFRLTAQQTDGSAKYYAGSYTVQSGKIVGSNVQQTG
jgi:hypothetical protein